MRLRPDDMVQALTPGLRLSPIPSPRAPRPSGASFEEKLDPSLRFPPAHLAPAGPSREPQPLGRECVSRPWGRVADRGTERSQDDRRAARDRLVLDRDCTASARRACRPPAGVAIAAVLVVGFVAWALMSA